MLGVLALRGIFSVVGAALLTKFHFLLYLLGRFSVHRGAQGLEQQLRARPCLQLNGNPSVRFLSWHLPRAQEFDGAAWFFTRRGGRRGATPPLVVLVLVEETDVVFAADSIATILAILRNRSGVYTSNVFVLLGAAGALLGAG